MAKQAVKGAQTMTIKELRKATGMTQAQFAAYIGCSKRAVESWEGGKRQPADFIVKLIEYYLTNEGKIKEKWRE